MRAQFERLEWENDSQTIASFLFTPNDPYQYEAGQYAVLGLPHAQPDSRGTERTMTLSSSPDDELLKFTMRLSPHEESSSFKNALRELEPGDVITIYDSMGDLVLPLDKTIPLVFVAGGVGIASFVGMTKWLADNKQKRDIRLLYGVSRPEDVIMQQPFDAYAALGGLTKVLYAADSDTITYPFKGEIVQRRLSAADIMASVQPDSLLYLSGPEPMVMNLQSDLKAASFNSQQLIFDYFEGYDEQA